ncbi:MAG: carboxypeptidase-like regulatory domain-containing protein, partial [Bacteroidota bacterium]
MKLFYSKKTIAILFFMVAFIRISLAQITVTGTVTTADTKETLPGATIVVKGTNKGGVTNIDGQFSINVKDEKAVLVISFVGYKTKEQEVGKSRSFTIVLEPQKTTLDELVVIGYGTVRKSDLSGSVGSIKSDDIIKITALNPVQSLQGQVTGVQVTSISGTPGESPVVRIRGTGSFGNSSPIYVVDGVILDDISFLNCNDIKSMEILKDASATAIYGSRGANGVILVTTKNGKPGDEKTVFSASADFGMQRLAKRISLLSGKQFAAIRNEIQPGYYNNIDGKWRYEDFIFEELIPYVEKTYRIKGEKRY